MTLGEGEITLHTGQRVRLPPEILTLLNRYLAGDGSRPVVAEELRRFGRVMWDRLYQFIDSFESPDDPLMGLLIDDNAAA